jgi:hypothetical protein
MVEDISIFRLSKDIISENKPFYTFLLFIFLQILEFRGQYIPASHLILDFFLLFGRFVDNQNNGF